MDLPLPDTPVTQVKQPKGIFKSIFFKLFPVAPPISRNLPFFANFLPLGIVINFLLDTNNTHTNAQEVFVDGGWLSW